MRIELLTIGTELLLGHVVDTNGAEIGRSLAAAGVRLVRRTSVPDEPEAVRTAMHEALERTGAFLSTGGLGPTADDVTKKAAADLLGAPLEFRDDIWQELLARYHRFGRRLIERNRCQAEVPAGATVLPNRWGTAPGLWLETSRGLAILLPGVPAEMRGLLHQEVLPRLASRSDSQVIQSRTLRTFGIAESSLADRLARAGVEEQPEGLSLAYLPGQAGVDLRLTAWGLPAAEAEGLLARGIERLRGAAEEWIYGEDEDDLAALVIERLRRRGIWLGVAESCTGGWIGQRITSVPGSSDVFVGGVVAYDNRLKRELLGVPQALIDLHGAVSEQVALAMVEGAARRLGVEAAVAITGIAGPGGGTEDKPVGLVYTAIKVGPASSVHRHVYVGDRADVRARASQGALFHLFRALA